MSSIILVSVLGISLYAGGGVDLMSESPMATSIKTIETNATICPVFQLWKVWKVADLETENNRLKVELEKLKKKQYKIDTENNILKEKLEAEKITYPR